MSNFVASNLKELNRRSVYMLLLTENELSKAEIARRTGISAPTVMKIIDYFIDFGIVEKAGDGNIALGRKPHMLRYMPQAVYAIGVEFDGFHLHLGIVDLAGGIKASLMKVVDHDVRVFLAEDLITAIRELIISSGILMDKIVGLGLGIPGVVGPKELTLSFAPLVGVEKPLDLTPFIRNIESELQLSVYVENDANAAALGEYSARGLGVSGDLLYIELGRGVGSALILDGHLRKGPRSFTGELGYLVFDGEYSVQSDKPGWLESRLDLSDFWTEVARAGMPSDKSIRRTVDLLALAITNICVTLDIELVVIGSGGINTFLPQFIEILQKEVNRFSVVPIKCELPVSTCGGVSGAAALASERWLEKFLAG